jgi:hypothetical protein
MKQALAHAPVDRSSLGSLGVGRAIRMIGAFMVVTSVALASLNSCVTSTANQTLSNTGTQDQNGYVVAVPNATGDPLSTVNNANGTGLGCTTTDLTFSNFVVAGAAGLNPAATTATTYLAATSATNLEFATINQNTTADTTNNFISSSGGDAYTDNILNSVSVSGAKVYGIDISVSGYEVTNTGALTFTLYVCNGGTATGTAFTTCTGTGNPGGTLISATYSIPVNTLNSGTVVLPFDISIPAGTTAFYMDTAIGIDGSGTVSSNGNTNTFLGDYNETFELSPEPSTFILLGSALAGLGALRLRKSRQS